GAPVGSEVLVSVRPERILLGAEAPAGCNAWTAAVADSVYQGDHLRVQLAGDPAGLVVRAGRGGTEWQPGATVTAAFSPADCWVIPS
ncbi:TOBE domain-containing protein, partial [Amaricoccus sp.]|uniref:TOBE domain-containing protein n=1 Tax=Amaricoccus sp. TaxID=1872485 RepID=UPI00260186AC